MTHSTIDQLAEFQEEHAPLAGSVRRSPEEIVEDLDALGDTPNLAEVEALTAELASALSGVEKLKVAVVRETYIRSLHGKLSAPARLFDQAMGDRGAVGRTAEVPGQGRPLALEIPDPWPEPVAGAELLRALVAVFRRFVVLEETACTVLALWVLHTYVFDVFWITPRLAITSPEKRCGKTLVLTLLARLVAKPLLSANASPAAIFRCVEQTQPTLLIDEADTFLYGKDELRGILNSGHQQDGGVLRTIGDDHEPRSFSTFSPCAIAMIGKLPDTLEDRSIAIRMARKRPGETAERLRRDRLGWLEELRSRAVRWASDHQENLKHADPEVPAELHDRAADNWRSLLAIADEAGGEWPEHARQAAIDASAAGQEDSSAAVRLIEDLRSLLTAGAERMSSQEIVAKLIEMEDRPWPEWKGGKPLTVRQLARLLEPFGIKPRQIRFRAKTCKGYRLDDCRDAFARYLPDSIRNKGNIPLESVTCEDFPSETVGGCVSHERTSQTTHSMRVNPDVSDVSDRNEAIAERSRMVRREVINL